MSVKQTALRGTVARFKKNPFFAGSSRFRSDPVFP